MSVSEHIIVDHDADKGETTIFPRFGLGEELLGLTNPDNDVLFVLDKWLREGFHSSQVGGDPARFIDRNEFAIGGKRERLHIIKHELGAYAPHDADGFAKVLKLSRVRDFTGFVKAVAWFSDRLVTLGRSTSLGEHTSLANT